MKAKLIIGILVATLIVGVGIWYWLFRPQVKPPETVGEAIEAISEVPVPPTIEVKPNPVQGRIPELNPVEKANPFKYTNPF